MKASNVENSTKKFDQLKQVEVIYAYVENSGRLDQIMANIQTLFLAQEYLSNIPIYIINSENISCLLEPGKHHLQLTLHSHQGDSEQIDSNDFLSKLHCGLIPMAGPTIVSTSGLKWNVTNEELKFGALISTSNAFSNKDIYIETDKPLLWTMDIMK